VSGHSLISADILASYAADAALATPGVTGLVESGLHRHKGVRILEEEDRVGVELHVAVVWGTSVAALGADLQRRVADYLGRMADIAPDPVDVVVDEVAPPVPAAG